MCGDEKACPFNAAIPSRLERGHELVIPAIPGLGLKAVFI